MKYGVKKRLILPILARKPETVEAKREADKKEDAFYEKYMQEKEYQVSERQKTQDFSLVFFILLAILKIFCKKFQQIFIGNFV